MNSKESFSTTELYRQCDPDQFEFETTADLSDTITVICQARGLTGEQGVLIPAANVENLMLRHDVVAAAADYLDTLAKTQRSFHENGKVEN
jgi:hypothetical protein